MARLISPTVKGFKIDLITKLMEKGITKFEIDTTDVECCIVFTVKQAIKPGYTQEVTDYFNTLEYVKGAYMFMAPRPGNNEHMEAVVVVPIMEAYDD